MKPRPVEAASERPAETDLFYIGSDSRMHVLLSSMWVGPQIRKTYDQTDMADLELSIDRPGKNGAIFNIINNPDVALFTDKSKSDVYVAELNAFWGTNVKGPDRPDPLTGMYVAVVTGNRRTVATGNVADRKGVDRGHVVMAVDYEINPTFASSLLKQLQENEHVVVKLDEEARAIELVYRNETANNPKITKAQLAGLIGKSAAKVYDALLFVELPDEIKECVARGTFTYGISVTLASIQREYLSRHARWMRDGRIDKKDQGLTPEQWAAERVRNYALSLQEQLERSRRQGSSHLGRIASLHLRQLAYERRWDQKPFEMIAPELGIAADRDRLVAALAKVTADNLGVALIYRPEILKEVLKSNPDLVPVVELIRQAAEEALVESGVIPIGHARQRRRTSS